MNLKKIVLTAAALAAVGLGLVACSGESTPEATPVPYVVPSAPAPLPTVEKLYTIRALEIMSKAGCGTEGSNSSKTTIGESELEYDSGYCDLPGIAGLVYVHTFYNNQQRDQWVTKAKATADPSVVVGDGWAIKSNDPADLSRLLDGFGGKSA